MAGLLMRAQEQVTTGVDIDAVLARGTPEFEALLREYPVSP